MQASTELSLLNYICFFKFIGLPVYMLLLDTLDLESTFALPQTLMFCVCWKAQFICNCISSELVFPNSYGLFLCRRNNDSTHVCFLTPFSLLQGGGNNQGSNQTGSSGTRILIKGGTVVNSHLVEVADVYIENSKICEVGPNITKVQYRPQRFKGSIWLREKN